MFAAATENGLCMLEFTDSERNLLKNFEDFLIVENSSLPLFKELKLQIEEYFNKNRTKFDLKLDLHGTDFQKRVWNELLNIEYGKTRTYLNQSKELGDVLAIRAVANANGRNKIAIVIPCHRVIGSDGSLTGYAGKVWRKKFLLKLESRQGSLF